MNYGKYGGFIIERLLKIIKKISQLRETAKKMIQKSQAELDRKFEGMKI